MINREIMSHLKKEIGQSPRRIYQMITSKRKEYKNLISKEVAANFLAADYEIDLYKILGEEELAELHKYERYRYLEPSIGAEERPKVSKEKSSKEIVINFDRGLSIKNPFLPETTIREAERMSKIYPVVYVFENSVRYLIMRVLEKHGNDWWEKKVPKDVKKHALDRKREEEVNKWHGKRSLHNISYIDIKDLISIIKNNWNDFKNIFPNQSWIEVRINEIGISRNAIAHNTSLIQRDIDRIKMYFADFENQVKDISLSGDNGNG